jgi:hypothetical protein
MAFTGSNDYTTGRANPITPAGAELASMRFALAMATADLALNSIGQIGILPAGCLPVQVLVDGTDMDTGAAAMVLTVGIGNLNLTDAAGAVSADLKDTLLSTKAADGGAAWGSTTAVATAFQQQILSQPMASVTAVNYDRAIVVKVATAPTTPAAGTLGLTLIYRAA